MNCYNCGTELNPENKTREHIPAKNLFNGYSEEYKKNRIVVPACFVCNNSYSQIDQEIRDAIGILNENNDQQKEMTRQAVKSIMRQSNWKKRVDLGNSEMKNISVTFRYDDLKELHLKNFKGIFFHKYQFPLPQNYKLEIIAEGDERNLKLVEIKKMMKNYLSSKDWQVSGHEDVFRYKMSMLNFSEPSEKFDFSETENINECDLIISEFYYHNTINPVLFAASKTLLEEVREKKE